MFLPFQGGKKIRFKMLIFGGVKFNLLRAKNYENYMQTDNVFSKHHCIRLHTLTRVVVSTHLKNIRQIGSFPQVGVKKKYLKTPPSYYSIYIYCRFVLPAVRRLNIDLVNSWSVHCHVQKDETLKDDFRSMVCE